jgi:hypothetical protein
MHGLMATTIRAPATRLAWAIVSAVVVLALPVTGSAANAVPYSLRVSALTGPQGGLLRIEVDAEATAPAVETLKIVQISVNGAMIRVLKDVSAPDGVAEIELGPVARGATVSASVHVRSSATTGLVLLRRAAIARLRPDLVVAAVHAPPQTLTTRSIDVVADVSELNGDVGATATLTLMLGPTPLAEPKTVTVPKGGEISSTFKDVKLETAMSAELSVRVDDAAPFETDATNNSRSSTVEVTEHELVRSNVLVQALGGYGAQFNNHVYAPITPWPAGTGYGDFEDKAKALQPHLVRIFYNDNWDGNRDGRFPNWPENYASFVKVVRLAQEAGATIDISFQNLGNARSTPGPDMAKFADVLEDLVRNHGLTNVRWAEVGNEPNSGGAAAISLEEFNVLVRTLDQELRARGLRDHIKLMGPGLVENAGVPSRTHYVWMQWIAANMGDLFDAWAQHVYWFYNDAGRLEYRLRDAWHLNNEVLPPEQRKPTYMMEYGIRGIATCGTKPSIANTYYAGDPACPEIWRTNIGGFQQFWFAIGSAQLGYTGAAKWDAFWGVYDRTLNPPQVYWTVGPASEGSPLTPSYHALALLFHTTVPGWQVVRVAPWDESDWGVPTYGIEGHSSKDPPEKELAAYAGESGELTILGLDTQGRALNGPSAEPPSPYSVGGLPANTTFNLALWNATGNGENSLAEPVTTDAAGVARFEVPLQAAFSLTTVPVS